VRHCVLDAGDGGPVGHVAGDPHHEQLAEPGIEGDLGHHAAVGAAEDDGERQLALGEHLATRLIAAGALGRAIQESLVTLRESLARFVCCQSFRFALPVSSQSPSPRLLERVHFRRRLRSLRDPLRSPD